MARKADKGFYMELAKIVRNVMDKERYPLDWVANRLQEIAKEWHFPHKRMERWVNDTDMSRIDDKVREMEWEDLEDGEPRERITISLLTNERKVWQTPINK